MSLTLWKALVPTSTKHPSVAVLQNMLFPKSYYLNVYKCSGACRQHAVYVDQMLSQSRKENVAIQSHHCLLHFVFSIHGNLALQGFVYPSMFSICSICLQRICLPFSSHFVAAGLFRELCLHNVKKTISAIYFSVAELLHKKLMTSVF